MKSKIAIVLIILLSMSMLAGCQQNSAADNSTENTSDTSNELENGVSAIEDAMSQENVSDSSQQKEYRQNRTKWLATWLWLRWRLGKGLYRLAGRDI